MHITSPSIQARFWPKVRKSDGCWNWTAGVDGGGYGLFRTEGHTRAHRVAYEMLVGPIPNGLVLDHLCRNRSCVNPAHLEPVTIGENVIRGDHVKERRGRTHCPRGHILAQPNLVGLKWEKGQRECLACARGRSAVHKHGGDLRVVSDQKYASIMKE